MGEQDGVWRGDSNTRLASVGSSTLRIRGDRLGAHALFIAMGSASGGGGRVHALVEIALAPTRDVEARWSCAQALHADQ